MGNRKKLVLASLVSVMMMLSFAIGLVPSQLSGPPTTAKAAQSATQVAISADGVTAVGDKFSIPVGGEQSFTALSVTNGAATHLIPTGEAEWSLATDGSAALSAVNGDFVATVSALAPGEAGLYVSTGDGLVDLVNLTLYNLKGAKNGYSALDSVTITHPINNTTLVYQTGATGIPLTLTSKTNNPTNTAGVAYSDSTKADLGSSATPPYAVTIPDVTALAPSATITAVASSIAKYTTVSDSVNITLEARNADANGDGLPDDPFGLNLGYGEEWISSVNVGGHNRIVHVTGLGTGSAKAIDIPADGLVVTIADPNDATRVVTVTVPPNLMTAGQAGVLVLEVADDIPTLLGATQAANVKPEPAGGLVAGGQYVEVGILVTTDAGATFSEIPTIQLEDHPVTLEMQLSGVLSSTDNVRFFAYPTNITNGSPIAVTANASGEWAQSANGTQVEVGKLTTELTSLSLIAPYATPSAIRILSVSNTSIDTDVAGAKDYSIGGGTLDVLIANKPVGAVVITVDGNVAAQSKIIGDTVTIVAPAANALATPAASANVDIRVEDASDATSFDISPKGFTYVGPIITSVAPPSGTEAGGDGITITGKGLATGGTADLGGAAVANYASGNSTTVTGTTGSHTPGKVAATVALASNYMGTLAGAFTYTPEDPVLDSVFPNIAYNDGGYTVRANGSHFVDPNTQFKSTALTQGFFTTTKGAAAPGSDNQAISVEFLDDSHLNLITPVVATVGLYDVYVSTDIALAKVQQLSNLVDFTFKDSTTATMTITSVTPNQGPLGGGTAVAIAGTGFPVGGSGGDITSGNVLRVADAFAANGTIVTIPLSLFRGTDATAAPATIDTKITFDSSVLSARNGGVADPAFVADALLGTWYSKTASVSAATAGEINLVISGGVTEITTFDDQRFGGTPTDQHNPFTLGIMRFDVVGATNATTSVKPTEISMANAGAVGITDAKEQDGFFNVGTSAATPPPAVVHFGVNAATIDSSKLAQTSTLLNVIAPEGERAGKVDVRVEDPADSTLFAVSRADETYAAGGGYEYKPGLAVTSIEPNAAWAFGGTVAHIQGAQFEYTAKSISQVYFGAVLADVAPAPYVSTATDLYVIVPQLPSPSATLAVPSVTVDITVKNSNNETQVKSNFFTYDLYNTNTESRGIATGNVITTGFTFPTATGTGATGQKVSLSDDATTAATFTVPAVTAGKTASTQTFALVRATKTAQLFDVQDLPGTAIPNVWNFDIHLYSGDYPFDELNVSYNTGQTPITLRYPTDDTTLPLALNSGILSTYSHDSSFAYNFPSGDLTVDTESSLFQSNVLPSEEVVTSGNIAEVTSRLYHLSAVALRANAKPPVISCDLETGPHEVKNGDTVDLTGQGLGWITGIQVFTDSDVTSKSITSVLAGDITSDEFHASFRFPNVTANADGPAQLQVTVNDGTPAGKIIIVNGLTVKKTTNNNNNGLLQLILGILAALIGLAAGGNHGGGGGGPCFIATAAYGTPMADQIDTLRAFRDVYLLNNSVGSAFVDVYYHVSPAVADVVAKSPVLAAAVRMVLVPIILLAKMALAMPQVTFALSLLSGLAMYLRRAKKAKKA